MKVTIAHRAFVIVNNYYYENDGNCYQCAKRISNTELFYFTIISHIHKRIHMEINSICYIVTQLDGVSAIVTIVIVDVATISIVIITV